MIAPAKQQGIYPNFMPSADSAIPMIATPDVSRLVAGLLTAPAPRSEVVDLLGPAYSPRQLAERLGAALGRPLRIVDVPAAGHVAALQQAGLPAQMAEAVAELYAAFAAGLIVPHGDRSLAGTTTIDEVLAGLLAAGAGERSLEPRA